MTFSFNKELPFCISHRLPLKSPPQLCHKLKCYTTCCYLHFILRNISLKCIFKLHNNMKMQIMLHFFIFLPVLQFYYNTHAHPVTLTCVYACIFVVFVIIIFCWAVWATNSLSLFIFFAEIINWRGLRGVYATRKPKRSHTHTHMCMNPENLWNERWCETLFVYIV